MATEYKKIVLRRGTGTPPTDLLEGELAYQTDTGKLFVGTGDASPNHYAEIVTTLAELGITATAEELNTLDGVTATTAELNTVDGFTGTVDDLNYAKDLRATGVTATEFDYLDGVTSNIQTQLDAVGQEWFPIATVAQDSAATLTLNDSNLGEVFDWTNYDYKFVINLETTGETAPADSTMYFEVQSAGQYSYIRSTTRVTGTSTNEAVTTSEWGATSTTIPFSPLHNATGVATNASYAVHALHAEIVITRPYLTTIGGSINPGFLIKGEGVTGLMSNYADNPNINYAATAFGNFAGVYDRDSAITEVNITSGFDDGTNDKIVVRVYKRAK